MYPALLFREEQVCAVRGERLGNVRRILRRRGEAFDRTLAIGALPENAVIALAVRLECHPFAVMRPDRMLIPPFDRQATNRARRSQVVYRNVGVATFIDGDGQTPAIW